MRLLIPLSILLGFAYYFCHQLFAYSGVPFIQYLPEVLGILLMVAAIATLPLLFWRWPHLREKPGFQTWMLFIYFSLSYMTYLLCLIVVRDLGEGIAWFLGKKPFEYSLREAWLFLILPLVFTGIGAWLAARGPRVKTVAIAHPKLARDPYRIAQISDLHVGPSVGPASVRRVVERTNELDADVIVLTGDIIDGNPAQNEAALEVLKTLKAREGVFFIPGNHEYFHDYDRTLEAVKRLGFRVLVNEHAALHGGRVLLGGVPDRMAVFMKKTIEDVEGLLSAMRKVSEQALLVLLEHQPHNADRNSRLGFDLQLSGHTHDGQFYPWTIVVRMVQKYSRGRYKIGSMELYVNPGTMYWGPPNRFGPSSEITLLELTGV